MKSSRIITLDHFDDDTEEFSVYLSGVQILVLVKVNAEGDILEDSEPRMVKLSAEKIDVCSDEREDSYDHLANVPHDKRKFIVDSVASFLDKHIDDYIRR